VPFFAFISSLSLTVMEGISYSFIGGAIVGSDDDIISVQCGTSSVHRDLMKQWQSTLFSLILPPEKKYPLSVGATKQRKKGQ